MLDEYIILANLLSADFDVLDVVEKFSPHVIESIVKKKLMEECRGAFEVKVRKSRKVPVCRVSREGESPHTRAIHVGKAVAEILSGGSPKLGRCEKLMVLLVLAEMKMLS